MNITPSSARIGNVKDFVIALSATAVLEVVDLRSTKRCTVFASDNIVSALFVSG